jgi:hypothetical protein
LSTLHFAQATGGDLVERPSDGEGVGSPLSRGEDDFLASLMFQLESEVLVQLADWGSIANPASMGDFLSPTLYVAPHSVSTAPLASLWSEDILVPTSGDRGDGDVAVPLDGEDISPSVPCYCQ